MAHITAGDLVPLMQWTESTYGTPTGNPLYYADIAEGGGFTPSDTLNPYISWRYGNRSFDQYNYVNQQLDAGFQASLEVRDVEGWADIAKYAWGASSPHFFPATTPYGSLPSRSEAFLVRTGLSTYEGRRYTGCKTDSLTISCDEPGGIVKFEETVLAGSATPYNTPPAGLSTGEWQSEASPAVQWTGPVTIAGAEVYPQSFKLTVNNNLERVRVPGNPAYTGALIEGRREIIFEIELWMEDLAYMRSAMDTTAEAPRLVTFDLGEQNPYTVTLGGIIMREGQHSTLIQDKQKETVRFRCNGVSMEPA
jgi:hypothetical protein